MKNELSQAISDANITAINKFKGRVSDFQQDWPFVQKCLRDVVASNNIELCLAVVKLFSEGNLSAYQVNTC